MPRMKHLLRKLHIGGGLNEPQEVVQTRLEPVPAPPHPATASSSDPSPAVAPIPPPPRRDAVESTAMIGGAVGDAPGESSGGFNFFKEEFQVQLALAISASDPGASIEDAETAQIKAAEQISLMGSAPTVPNFETLDESLSFRYWNYSFINYDEKVVDGFYDVYGIRVNTASQGKMPLLMDLQAISRSDHVDYEVILVDRKVDLELQELENRACCISMEFGATKQDPFMSGLVQKIAELVVCRMGGPVSDADDILRRWRARSFELGNSLNTIMLHLGRLDVGLSRHRALLFKVLADKVSLPCMLVKGSYYTGTDEGAVNIVKSGNGSEYIIDLMGAPGVLIPAEVPSGHLQNSRSDVRSFASVTGMVKDSNLELDKVIRTLAVSHVLDRVPVIVGSSKLENAGIQIKEDDNKNAEKNRTEKFEQEFGRLLPSLHLSRENSLPSSGKDSPAQKMQVKDVSKYVISAAKNPEFAQKLHAVLSESGASPPSNLFMDMGFQDIAEQKMLDKTELIYGQKIDDEVQSHSNKSVSNAKHSSAPPLPSETTNDGYVVVGCGANERMEADSTVDSCQRPLELVGDSGQCFQENAGVNPLLGEVAEWEIPWEDLQIGERVGIGSYGEVYRADWNGTERIYSILGQGAFTHFSSGRAFVYPNNGLPYKLDGREVAVKKFLDQDLFGEALVQLKYEVEIMIRLRHPNVVLFMGVVTHSPYSSILTEFLPRGSLYKLLHRTRIQLDERRRMRMAVDVAKGMNYLHTGHPPIVHRDLKSPNLLVDKNWVVKVCDFGLSRLKNHTFLSSKSMAGTAEWMAPEVLRNEPSNEKCDVYSFGVILWELATLRVPWSGLNPMQVVGAVGFQNRRLEIPVEVDPLVAQIILDCWQSEPHLRPSFSKLISRLRSLQRLVVGRL